MASSNYNFNFVIFSTFYNSIIQAKVASFSWVFPDEELKS